MDDDSFEIVPGPNSGNNNETKRSLTKIQILISEYK